jgi:hypothetical protein
VPSRLEPSLSGESSVTVGVATRFRLVRTNEVGNSVACRYALGNKRGNQETKICIKPRVEGGSSDWGTAHRGKLVALEPNSLYVQATKDTIFLLPYLPCDVLEEPFVMALLEQTKDLSEWSALFTSIINAVEDHGADHTLPGKTFERWQERVCLPLHTPGCIRTSRFPLTGE